MAVDSIWSNNFYNKSPVPKWMFEMDFTQLIIDDKNKLGYGSILSKAVVSCSWPERNITSIPVYFAGVEGKYPGRVSNSGELEIKFNENSSFLVTKILEELFHADSACDAYYENKGSYSFNKKFEKTRRTIRMLLLAPVDDRIIMNPYGEKEEKRPVVIEFHNCWLSKIGSEEFSYENNEDTITRTATFTYDYFKVLGNGETNINDTCAGEV
jgi:hypothetical protein